MSSRRYTQLTLYRRLLLQARPYWLHVAGTLVLNVLSAPLALLIAAADEAGGRQRAGLGADPGVSAGGRAAFDSDLHHGAVDLYRGSHAGHRVPAADPGCVVVGALHLHRRKTAPGLSRQAVPARSAALALVSRQPRHERFHVSHPVRRVLRAGRDAQRLDPDDHLVVHAGGHGHRHRAHGLAARARGPWRDARPLLPVPVVP